MNFSFYFLLFLECSIDRVIFYDIKITALTGQTLIVPAKTESVLKTYINYTACRRNISHILKTKVTAMKNSLLLKQMVTVFIHLLLKLTHSNWERLFVIHSGRWFLEFSIKQYFKGFNVFLLIAESLALKFQNQSSIDSVSGSASFGRKRQWVRIALSDAITFHTGLKKKKCFDNKDMVCIFLSSDSNWCYVKNWLDIN